MVSGDVLQHQPPADDVLYLGNPAGEVRDIFWSTGSGDEFVEIAGAVARGAQVVAVERDSIRIEKAAYLTYEGKVERLGIANRQAEAMCTSG